MVVFMIVTTSDKIEGKEIESYTGFIMGSLAAKAGTKDQVEAKKKALYGLFRKGKEDGADGIISVKLDSVSYKSEETGEEMVEYTYYGTAVKFKN